MTGASLVARQFTCRYSDVATAALSNVSLEVGSGEVVGIAGPSGCGKSTLLHAACGLIPHSISCDIEGEFQVLGRALRETSVGELSREVQIVLQRPGATFIAATAAEEMSLGMRNFGGAEATIAERVGEMLERFELGHVRDRYPHSLSAGERQKTSLASALLLDPRLLLLDEPTANLDPPATREFMRMLLEARERSGLSALVVEHDLRLLEAACDRIVWLADPVLKRPPAGMASRTDGFDSRGGEPLATARQISVEAEDTSILVDVTVNVYPGDVVALVGPNGAGKTTFAKVLSGLIREFGGSCLVGGLDPARADLQALARKVGYVSQDPLIQLFAPNCVDEVAFRGANLGIDDPLPGALSLLERAGLGRYRDVHPMNLSVGEQRRLTTISQFQPPPELLVVDEPTTGLDYHWAEQILQLVDEHAASGGAVLLLTHDLEAARAHATRVVALKEGRVVADSPAADFFGKPAALALAGLGSGGAR